MDKTSYYKVALRLVKDNIKWFRMCNSEIPIYTHSIRVYNLLKKYNLSEDIQIAWLLHDIIEDSEITFDDLSNIWFNENIIKLVWLATDNYKIKDKDRRWENLINNLIKSWNKGAWCIKIADLSDNIMQPYNLDKPWFRNSYLLKKCSVFCYYWNKYLSDHPLFHEFLRRFYIQSKKYFIESNYKLYTN